MVMDQRAPLSEHGPPTFQAEVAVGSAGYWNGLQMHTRLPRFAVHQNPNLSNIAESWIRGFLRHRSYDGYGVECVLENAFASFAVTDDEHTVGGCWVEAVLKESWKRYQPQGQVAYHGTTLAAIYSILLWGLKQGPSPKQARNRQVMRGVFVHKHGTKHKARHYMKYFMFPEGFLLSVLLQCRVADPPTRRTCPPDQWCLPEDGVQVEKVYFHFVRFEDATPGAFWTWGQWEPKHEANPW
jgi:hypothetical protein